MKKINNKILILGFVALAVIFVLTRLFRSPGRESNLDVEALHVDTSKVSEVVVVPQKDSSVEVALRRTAGHWTATRRNVVAEVLEYKVDRLLDLLAAMKPDRVVTRKKEKWSDYNVTDSLATKVIVKGPSDILTLLVGKENAGSTYVRKEGEDEVYAVTQPLDQTLNVNFASWRDQAFLKVAKTNVTEIQFNYPADSGFVVKKANRQWMIGNTVVDSAKVDQYLSKWNYREHLAFADNIQVGATPDVTLIFKTNDNHDVIVKGWRKSFYQWVLNSTVQPKTNFLDEGGVLTKELFATRKDFISVRK